MRLIIIILSLFITSCLTQKRFNKVLNKGIEKGWIDTTTKIIDTTIINFIDTNNLKEKILKSIKNTLEKDTTIYIDTCYNKQGKVIGKLIDENKLTKKLSEKINEEVVLPLKVKCLSKPIFINKDGVIVEIYQDSLGQFKIKAKIKDITINRPSEKGWFERYIKDVWFYLAFIILLVLALILKK